MTRGWYNDSPQHALASKGVKTRHIMTDMADESYVRSLVQPFAPEDIKNLTVVEMTDSISIDFDYSGADFHSSITYHIPDETVEGVIRLPSIERSELQRWIRKYQLKDRDVCFVRRESDDNHTIRFEGRHKEGRDDLRPHLQFDYHNVRARDFDNVLIEMFETAYKYRYGGVYD